MAEHHEATLKNRMPSCCYDDEYGEMFSSREAARTALQFRRRGLRGTAAELADAVLALAPEGSSLIEAGGGAGQIQIALLETGAVAKSLNVELSESWEEAGLALIREHGLEERVERRIGDFVDQAESLPAADVVILHRVVCCYPDWKALLATASGRAKEVVGMTIPAYRWWNRLMVGLVNLTLNLRGMQFRAFVHPTQPMVDLMTAAGFRVAYDRTHPVWRTMAFTRIQP
jgi:magnesium-protoporphyrin O-methyltransferase